MDKLFLFLDRHSVVASLVLIFICCLTGYSFSEMIAFAQVEPPSVDRASVIAAVLTPVSGLMASAITFYNKRKEWNDRVS